MTQLETENGILQKQQNGLTNKMHQLEIEVSHAVQLDEILRFGYIKTFLVGVKRKNAITDTRKGTRNGWAFPRQRHPFA